MPESAAMQASIEPPGTPQRPATPALGARYSEQRVPYDVLCERVQEAWNAIDENLLEELLESMRDHCKVVITEEGKYTKY